MNKITYILLLISINALSQPVPAPSTSIPIYNVGFSNLPSRINYLNDVQYTIKKDFFDMLFSDTDIKGVKISFKINDTGIIVLVINGIKDDVLVENQPVNEDAKSYNIYPNEILTGQPNLYQTFTFGLENLNNIQDGFVKSYTFGRVAIYGGYNNGNNGPGKNCLVFKIAKARLLTGSIYNYLYLVVQRKNDNENISFIPFTSTISSFTNTPNRVFRLIPMGGGGGGGNSKPCPPFGCND